MIILDDVEFEPATGVIKCQSTEKLAKLSYTNAMLLEKLIQNKGKIVSRENIFTNVFERTGATKSNGNLNQCIALIRKSFTDVGYHDEIIITIPKAGFAIRDSIHIEEHWNAEVDAESEMLRVDEVVIAKRRTPENIMIISAVATLLLMVVFLVLIKANQGKSESSVVENTMVIGFCKINFLVHENFPDANFVKSEGYMQTLLKNKKITCNHHKEIYYFDHRVEGVVLWEFMSVCHAEGKCKSYYVRDSR